jgi:hypothetical protein
MLLREPADHAHVLYAAGLHRETVGLVLACLNHLYPADNRYRKVAHPGGPDHRRHVPPPARQARPAGVDATGYRAAAAVPAKRVPAAVDPVPAVSVPAAADPGSVPAEPVPAISVLAAADSDSDSDAARQN